MKTPSVENFYQADHAALMMDSFQRALGRGLIGGDAKALYHADRVVLSHDGAADPVLTYGNLAAQTLWQMGWDDLTGLPSRLTAEPAERAERDAMFAEMREHGVITRYEGIRISASGQRFRIQNAVIWPLLDRDGVKRGEAACFDDWTYL